MNNQEHAKVFQNAYERAERNLLAKFGSRKPSNLAASELLTALTVASLMFKLLADAYSEQVSGV